MRCPPSAGRRGFTLIEVIGAVLIFSIGILMVIGLSRALAVQMERSAVASRVSVEVQERMDSLTTLPYASLPVGSSVDTQTIHGIAYERRATVSQFSAIVRQVTVSVEPVSGSGPSHVSTSYVSDRW